MSLAGCPTTCAVTVTITVEGRPGEHSRTLLDQSHACRKDCTDGTSTKNAAVRLLICGCWVACNEPACSCQRRDATSRVSLKRILATDFISEPVCGGIPVPRAVPAEAALPAARLAASNPDFCGWSGIVSASTAACSVASLTVAEPPVYDVCPLLPLVWGVPLAVAGDAGSTPFPFTLTGRIGPDGSLLRFRRLRQSQNAAAASRRMSSPTGMPTARPTMRPV